MINTEEHQNCSKYSRKHCEVASGYRLWEFRCPYCKGTFGADISWFAYEYKGDESIALRYCPYCGNLFKETI